MRKLSTWLVFLAVGCPVALGQGAPQSEPQWRDLAPVLKARCIKCHGFAKHEGKLLLATPAGLAQGGETGAAIVAGNADGSLLWQRIANDEMPPDDPLPMSEKMMVRDWIIHGAPGLPAEGKVSDAASDHWAFAPLTKAHSNENDIDSFLQGTLSARGLTPNSPADHATLIRRVSFDLTGLPPTPEDIASYTQDHSPDAYERMVERYLASPHYGERWGKFWLDAAGYADSNGYFNADTDRPLAYRYRDYVVRAFNDDKPFDRFVLEQVAGDELSGFIPEQAATPEMVSLLEATHFLRNGQDGTGESDGNADEVRIDRYSALEATMQIVSSSLLGLTFQCAKCHDHKFEPISQRAYYELQAVFFPAYDIEHWTKPNERFVYANLPGEREKWQFQREQTNQEIATLRRDFIQWLKDHPPPSTTLFHDEFDESEPPLIERWSATAPGDDTPGGDPAVALDTEIAPSASRAQGVLTIRDSGAPGDRWISTRQSFDWTPEAEGDWIQATFDLLDVQVDGGPVAERIGYFVALHDYNGNGASGGNLLVDGNPAGGATVYSGYPGPMAKTIGQLGSRKYELRHNWGIRITNIGKEKFLLEHLVDGLPEEKTLTLSRKDLPDGGFGFEYCCGRSFIVDNVVITRSAVDIKPADGQQEPTNSLSARKQALDHAIKAKEEKLGQRPGKIAAVFDREDTPNETHILQRGSPAAPGECVMPSSLGVLSDNGTQLDVRPPRIGRSSTGRRLAWAQWLTRPNSRAAALLARVQVNRIWRHHFGAGIVRTTENLGFSGAPPEHPELLNYLALRLIESGWSVKALHRMMLNTATYRRSSASGAHSLAADPENRLLWRYSLHRLDAESLRDAMLSVSGQLDKRFGGPYVPTVRDEQGEVLVDSGQARYRRSLYLQQRRTQTLSFLNVFDAPSLVFNCVERPSSTMPLQSLSLLNSDFAMDQSRQFALRLARESGEDPHARVKRAFLLAFARGPTESEMKSSLSFLGHQQAVYGTDQDSQAKACADFCQMLLASNAFLYVE